ncbi:MAG TPA: hypothetical protein VMW24_01470 [Sedimentisphaerales bacterium]|nr:hypothetical protein [Sedimentisphaerales bacterium]
MSTVPDERIAAGIPDLDERGEPDQNRPGVLHQGCFSRRSAGVVPRNGA